ncbi:putative protein MSS51 homolog, mitochondrial [Lycorma delicatula]|uniref:putative protein MSS51 homolog, mitochondrial n=1 Tax=Lycorma delicatula TaxID=130591 RepID=UPI003F518220
MGRKNKKSNKNKLITNSTTSKVNDQEKQEDASAKTINRNNIEESNSDNQNEFKQSNNLTENDLKSYTRKKMNYSNTEYVENKSGIINEFDLELLLTELKLKKVNKIIKQENNILKNYRDYYLNYLCQVCKQSVNSEEECKKCRMISYCSTEHRRGHWPVHADICEAIQVKCKLMGKTHILENVNDYSDAEQFKSYCYNLMLECQKRVKRKLDEWEVELFLYPNVCEKCYKWNKEELTSCRGCHQKSFCKPEHQHPNHKNYCNSLITYRKIIQHHYNYGSILTYFPETYMDKEDPYCLKGDINEILKKSKKELKELEYIQLTESATEPLTAAYSVKLFNQINNRCVKESITLHIIGAEAYFELNLLEKWEIFFLHYFPDIKTINLIFIGPELNINKEESKTLKIIELCDKCKNQKRKICYQFFDKTLYHHYTQLTDYLKPDLICAFNPGLYRETGFGEEDTWPATIKAMFKIENIPILVTAYTSIEILKDLKRIKDIQRCEIIKMPCQNPFSSLKPNLNFVSYEDIPVIFKNYYLTLLKK